MEKLTSKPIPFKCDPKNKNLNNTNLNSVIKHTYDNAVTYFLSATILSNFVKLQSNLINVIEVNMAFSIELFLKTILYYEEKNSNFREHNLFKLFDKLSDETKNKIKTTIIIDNDTAPFETILDEASEVFQYVRYCNEKIGSVVNISFLYNFATVLEEYCKSNIISIL